MKILSLAAALVLCLTLLCETTLAQPSRTYKHPNIDVQFQAPKDWKQIEHPENTNVYHIMSPDSLIHLNLWVEKTDDDPKKALKKIIRKKKMKITKKPVKKIIKDKHVWILEASGMVKGQQVYVIYTAAHYGKGICILQLWTPENSADINRKRMHDIKETMNYL